MKYSQLNILIANIYLIASFLTENIINKVVLILIAIFWLWASHTSHKMDMRFLDFEYKLSEVKNKLPRKLKKR